MRARERERTTAPREETASWEGTKDTVQTAQRLARGASGMFEERCFRRARVHGSRFIDRPVLIFSPRRAPSWDLFFPPRRTVSFVLRMISVGTSLNGRGGITTRRAGSCTLFPRFVFLRIFLVAARCSSERRLSKYGTVLERCKGALAFIVGSV